ncbi:MaoC/PaaZ C-terminal domain-containing protein [Terrarubrum flagellatum]|uniref:MaoC/PaaZ C-terminal domain-containing protein n=1 Tax=Terrirubrum flagellatum TaxID=2895980 RepID=UPI003144D675
MTISSDSERGGFSGDLPSRYWEDIAVGEETRSGAKTVSGADMVEFARKYDPQYFHADAELAKKSLFGGLVGSGIYTAALWRQMDHEVNGDIAWVCGVAWENVKWANPVRPGDVLVATSRCMSKRESRKRPDVGVATLHHEVLRGDGEVVMSFDSVDLVYRRPAA